MDAQSAVTLSGRGHANDTSLVKFKLGDDPAHFAAHWEVLRGMYGGGSPIQYQMKTELIGFVVGVVARLVGATLSEYYTISFRNCIPNALWW